MSERRSRRITKNAVVIDSFKALVKSKFLLFLVLAIIAIIWTRWRHITYVLLFPIVFSVVFARSLVCEGLMIFNRFKQALGYFDWWSLVDDKLYLGAVPMDYQFKELMERVGIEAVLSAVDDFEMTINTAIGRPIQIAEFKQAGLEHLHLQCPDFYPPPFKVLDRGADFIDKHLSERRKVYCHCKAGRGRSASIIMAYFLKYKYLDVNTAYSLLKSRRKEIFDRKSSQMEHLKKYAASLASGSNTNKSD